MVGERPGRRVPLPASGNTSRPRGRPGLSRGFLRRQVTRRVGDIVPGPLPFRDAGIAPAVVPQILLVLRGRGRHLDRVFECVHGVAPVVPPPGLPRHASPRLAQGPRLVHRGAP